MGCLCGCVCVSMHLCVQIYSIQHSAQLAAQAAMDLKLFETICSIVRLFMPLYSFPHSSPLDVSVRGDRMLSIRYRYTHITMYITFRSHSSTVYTCIKYMSVAVFTYECIYFEKRIRFTSHRITHTHILTANKINALNIEINQHALLI